MSVRPISFAPGYEVDELGVVYSTKANWRGYGTRALCQDLNSDGYQSVRLTINGVRKRLSVHRLVAAAYLPPRPSRGHEIRHLDGVKSNNFPDNLCWGTQQDNADDREAHGRTSRGESHSNAIKRGLPRTRRVA